VKTLLLCLLILFCLGMIGNEINERQKNREIAALQNWWNVNHCACPPKGSNLACAVAESKIHERGGRLPGPRDIPCMAKMKP
jgi:hypothetical protein